VFKGKVVLDLIQQHQKTASIGTKHFEYAELRGTSEFTSMAASTASGDGTSLLRHLKKHIVGQQDCPTSKLLGAIRAKAYDTMEAVPFGPNGTAVDCSLYTADDKGQAYGVGNLAFTHIAPSDLLEEEGWLSGRTSETPQKKVEMGTAERQEANYPAQKGQDRGATRVGSPWRVWRSRSQFDYRFVGSSTVTTRTGGVHGQSREGEGQEGGGSVGRGGGGRERESARESV
jgi:hypothetical protein